MVWTFEDMTRNNFDNIAKDILIKAFDETTFSRVKRGHIAKNVWDELMKVCNGDGQEMDNKLTIVMKKFEDFKQLIGESIADIQAKFLKLLE